MKFHDLLQYSTIIFDYYNIQFQIFFTIKNIRKMSNLEVAQVIQRQINNGQYSEAVDSINIVCSQPGNVLCCKNLGPRYTVN